jgi:uncharacterized protein (TIGR03084 family)
VGTIPDADEALAGQIAELDEFLAGLNDGDWARPSRCEGWSVSDVVLHLAQTNEMAIASAEGRFDEVVEMFTAGGEAQNVDEGAAIAVERERGQSPDAVFARWRASATAMRDRLAAADPGERVTWVAGQLSVRTLTTTRLAETWIHTGDVTHALGIEPAGSARLWHIARLAWRTLPYAFLRDGGRELSGPVAFELTNPEDEDDVWRFVPDPADAEGTEAATRVSGPARDLCLVAARRVDPHETALVATGPDAAAVLDLVRTYA